MTQVMQGVRILEVAEQTFVPAASAILAEWGAEVIKIEHAVRGDAMRGIESAGFQDIDPTVHVTFEHANRGKKSVGLDLATPEGLDLLYQLAATCDVFLCNKVPEVRKKLRIDVDDIKAQNPDIIYAMGTGQGNEGPDANMGGYDILSYWCRTGMAMNSAIAHPDEVPNPPSGAYGDTIGGLTIAGGIMGALYHRERTGEATTVDVSLLGVGVFSMSFAIAMSLQHGSPWVPPLPGVPYNPLVNTYWTADSRAINVCCLQVAKYWPEICRLIGRDDLADDPRFADFAGLSEHAIPAAAAMQEEFSKRTLEEWRELLANFSGQWTVVQNVLETANDPQVLANRYVRDYEAANGKPFRLTSPPIRFGGEDAPARRAPTFHEQGDDVLLELGLDWDALIDLKVRGIVA
jgi:crotonobetainyl-CoA:carnitine CoA-transferase CaiB-like acyl-CoA transferase